MLVVTAVPSVPVLFQWLKQIEGTEAALTQKMLDLEKEKVKAWEGGRGEGGQVLLRREAVRVRSHYLFACVSTAFALVLFWVIVIHSLRRSLSTYFGSLCS